MNKIRTVLLVVFCFCIVNSSSAQKMFVEILKDGQWYTYDDDYLEQVYRVFPATDVNFDITFKCKDEPSDFFSKSTIRFKFMPSQDAAIATNRSYLWTSGGLVLRDNPNETEAFDIASFSDLSLSINDKNKIFSVVASKSGMTDIVYNFRIKAVKMGALSFVVVDKEDRCTVNSYELSLDDGVNYPSDSKHDAFLFRDDELVYQSPISIEANMSVSLVDAIVLYEDVYYTGVVVDRFGFRWDSAASLKEPIASKADFVVAFYDNNGSIIDEGDISSIPINVKFTNQSLNGDSYQWFVYKPGVSVSSDNEDDLLLKADSSSDASLVEADGSLNYKYNVAGSDFNIKLIAYSANKVCSNTIIKPLFSPDGGPSEIQSVLEVPSIFIAADGELFKPKASFVSENSFEGFIFSRAGRKLYEYRDATDGWDGKIAGKDAPTGMYFYVFRVSGVEDKLIEKTGSFMMMRTK